MIRNKLIPICEELNDETILKLNILLNTMLNGKTIEEINLQMISSMKEQAGIHSNIIGDVVDAVAEAIHSDEGMEIYTGGATNIFRYPELSENGKQVRSFRLWKKNRIWWIWSMRHSAMRKKAFRCI